MTTRRALFNGTRAARLFAALRKNGGSTALVVAGSLLMPACAASTAFATTRVNRAHHASAPVSSGRAQAHVVRDEELHSSRVSGKKERHTAQSSGRTAQSSATRKGSGTSRHTRDREDFGHTANAKAGRKRHEQEPIDDPMPVRRADGRHGRHEIPREPLHGKEYQPKTEEEAAHRSPSWNAHSSQPLHNSTRSSSTRTSTRESEAAAVPEERELAPAANAPAVLPTHSGTPGNVARNLARRTPQGHGAASSPAADSRPSTENLTGVSQPRDDERLPMRSATQPALSTAARKQAVTAAFTHPVAPLPTISAPSAVPAPSNDEVVEGFGSEVDFRSPTIQLANRTVPVAPPHGTPTELALELREAAEVASKPMFVPLYNRDGKLVVPPPLKGSRDILVHQNQMADDAGLIRIQDDADLARLRRAHLLVDLEETASLRVNESLPENRRAARPWAVHFANDIANAFYSRFGEALQVNSAVRTVAYQLRLQRTNGNAAAVDGAGASPHLTGQAIDFGKRGMSMAQIAWMRSYLTPLIDAGKIDVEEEFQQACFHISIYASYAPGHKRAAARTELAQSPGTAHNHDAAVNDNEDLR